MQGYRRFSIWIKDEHAVLAVNSLAAYFGYQPTIDGQANPESKADYVKRKLASHVRGLVLKGERKMGVASITTTDVDVQEDDGVILPL